ncbi:MAG TPA: hypothetical protein VMF13_03270 [Luteitalea sp.]|nr:hypothetical protein [Luteitalea sp.]
MTPRAWSSLIAREVLVLPALCLLVAAGGGFRTDVGNGAWRFLPPTPMTLVLGLLLVGVLVRTGVVNPWLLIGPHRAGLANTSGAIVVVTLLLASAQLFTALTPEAGLLQVLASLFFLLMLLNTLAARPTRGRAMQSLGVVLLSAYVLKYVVLDALYAPEGSLARRVVTSLLEGVSLGALGYTSHGAATAYVAFIVVLSYLFVLVLLPGRIDDVDDVVGRLGEPSLPKPLTRRDQDATLAIDVRPAPQDPGDR